MKYGVIDIGSNSVRLMISNGVCTLYKTNIVTKLGEGVAANAILSLKAIERTVKAVKKLYDFAISNATDKVFIFATAAVRQSSNSDEFIKKVFDSCGIVLSVLSEAEEAYVSALGAIPSGFGGVIDVGGASTEIIVMKNGEIQYSKSLPIGSVKLYEMFLDNQENLQNYLLNVLPDFGCVPNTNFYAVGGTATSMASMLLKLEKYDASLVDGYNLEISKMYKLVKKLFATSIEERKTIVGLQPERAEVIASGVCLFYEIMKYLGIKSVKVSESDNLEGFCKWKMEGV